MLEQYNSDEPPGPNKFLTIQAVPQTSYRTSFHGKPPGFNSPVAGPGEGPQIGGGPGGAFAGFGVGGGAMVLMAIGAAILVARRRRVIVPAGA